MGRPRINNKHLPANVEFRHGAYHFRKNGKSRIIGKTKIEMFSNLLKIEQDLEQNQDTMNGLFDRYMTRIAPLKAETTQKSYRIFIENLKLYFGKMRPIDVKAIHIYKYLDERGKDTPVAANREFSLLSHVFTMAVRWGAVEINPCIGLKKHRESRRNRNVKMEEFYAVYSIADKMIQCIMDFAFWSVQRKSDILKIQLTDLREDGIKMHLSKVNLACVLEWTPEIEQVVARAKIISKERRLTKQAKKTKTVSLYLFPSRTGQKYTGDGFTSVWTKLMKRALEKKLISDPFRFHDIRHLGATEAYKKHGIAFAQQALVHTTERMSGDYIDGEIRIKPHRKPVAN